MPFSLNQLYDSLYPTLSQYADDKGQAIGMIQYLYDLLLKDRRASYAAEGGREPPTKQEEINTVVGEFYKSKKHTGKFAGLMPYGVPERMGYDLGNEDFDNPSKLFFNTPLGAGMKLGKRIDIEKKTIVVKKRLFKKDLVLLIHANKLKGNMNMSKAELLAVIHNHNKLHGGNILTSGVFKEFGDFGSDLLTKYPKMALQYAIDNPDVIAKAVSKVLF